MLYDIPVQRCNMPTSRTPCPWIGLLILLADPILPDHCFPPDVPSGEQQRCLSSFCTLSLDTRCSLSTTADITTCYRVGVVVVASFPKACDVLLGIPGCLLDLFSPHKGTENSNSNISKISWTTSFVSRKYMERTSFFKLSRCWLFGTFLPDNENAGGSAICIHRDLLPEEAIVTHVVTGQGRDHPVNIRSGRHSLVFVNVHFEPELP